MRQEFHTSLIGRLLFFAMGLTTLAMVLFTPFLFIGFGESFAAGGIDVYDALLQVILFAFCTLLAFITVHNFRLAFSRSPSLVLDDKGLYYRTTGAIGTVQVNWDQITAIVQNGFIKGNRLTIYARKLAKKSGSENLLFKAARKLFSLIFLAPYRFLLRRKKPDTEEQFSIHLFTVNIPMNELKLLLQSKQGVSDKSETHNIIQRAIDQSPHTFPKRSSNLAVGTMISFLALGALLLLPISGFLFGQNMYRNSLSYNPAARQTQELLALAKAGNADAQNKVGWRLSQGVGAPKSDRRAFSWYLRSAKQGFHKAQFNVGRAYEYGDGVSKDHGKAVEWYRKAAEQSFPMAQSALGYLYLKGRGVNHNYGKAIALFERAALKNDSKAFYQLGRMHEKGLVFEKSREKALEYFEKAALKNYPPAVRALKRMNKPVAETPPSTS